MCKGVRRPFQVIQKTCECPFVRRPTHTWDVLHAHAHTAERETWHLLTTGSRALERPLAFGCEEPLSAELVLLHAGRRGGGGANVNVGGAHSEVNPNTRQ